MEAEEEIYIEGPEIEGIVIDMEAVVSLAHDCVPSLCKDGTHCCAFYEIHATGEEAERLLGYLPRASKYAKGLIEDGEVVNPLDEDDEKKGNFTIDTDEEGLCAFSYLSKAGNDKSHDPLCSLHTIALDEGQRPIDIKPRCCHMWPLALSESDPPLLTVQDGVMDFPCNKKRRGRRTIDKGVADIIGDAFGEDFLKELKQVTKGGKWT